MLKVHSFERGFLWVAHCGSEIFKSKNPPQRNEENQLQVDGGWKFSKLRL